MARSSGSAAPGVFAWSGRGVRRVFEFMMTVQMHYFDAVGIEAIIVDQPFGEHHRLRRAVRLDIDLALKALKAVAVRIQEILIEGDTIVVHG
jgi:hypothetical protein